MDVPAKENIPLLPVSCNYNNKLHESETNFSNSRACKQQSTSAAPGIRPAWEHGHGNVPVPPNPHLHPPSSGRPRSGLCGQRHRRRPSILPITHPRQCHAGPRLGEPSTAAAPRSHCCQRLPALGSFFSLKTHTHVLFAFICELRGRVETRPALSVDGEVWKHSHGSRNWSFKKKKKKIYRRQPPALPEFGAGWQLRSLGSCTWV